MYSCVLGVLFTSIVYNMQ